MNLETLSIEELANLRDQINAKLAERSLNVSASLTVRLNASARSLLHRKSRKRLKRLLRSRSTRREMWLGLAGALSPPGSNSILLLVGRSTSWLLKKKTPRPGEGRGVV